MKMSRLLVDGVLCLILAFGFFGAAKVSYDNFNGSACPTIGFIPICYVVLIAYGLMIAGLAIRQNHCKHYFFSIGWGVAFVIALLGSLAELFAGGGVCPSTGSSGIRGASVAHPQAHVLHLVGPINCCSGAVSSRLLQASLCTVRHII